MENNQPAATYIFLDSSKTTKSTLVYGPEPAMKYLLTQRRLLMPIIRKFRGVVMDICWDSILAKFETPLDALFASVEIRDCYESHPDFKEIKDSVKIDLSGIGISKNKEVAEELGENHTEEGTVAIHGSDLIKKLKEVIYLYGFDFSAYNPSMKGHEEDMFVSVSRAGMEACRELKDKVILTVAPIDLTFDGKINKIASSHNAYRADWEEPWLWFFDTKQEAFKAAEDIFNAYEGKITVALSFGDRTLLHDNMKITSSYGVNSACKLAQDVASGKQYGIRVAVNVYKESPKEGAFELKDAECIGSKYWELI